MVNISIKLFISCLSTIEFWGEIKKISQKELFQNRTNRIMKVLIKKWTMFNHDKLLTQLYLGLLFYFKSLFDFLFLIKYKK